MSGACFTIRTLLLQKLMKPLVFCFSYFCSPFLDAGKREALADYALVVAVLALSFVASYFVRDIGSKYELTEITLKCYFLPFSTFCCTMQCFLAATLRQSAVL